MKEGTDFSVVHSDDVIYGAGLAVRVIGFESMKHFVAVSLRPMSAISRLHDIERGMSSDSAP